MLWYRQVRFENNLWNLWYNIQFLSGTHNWEQNFSNWSSSFLKLKGTSRIFRNKSSFTSLRTKRWYSNFKGNVQNYHHFNIRGSRHSSLKTDKKLIKCEDSYKLKDSFKTENHNLNSRFLMELLSEGHKTTL